jgi:hypothetical protein
MLTIEEQERLTDYATTTRYPGDYEDISLSEARRMTAIAERLLLDLLHPYSGLTQVVIENVSWTRRNSPGAGASGERQRGSWRS